MVASFVFHNLIKGTDHDKINADLIYRILIARYQNLKSRCREPANLQYTITSISSTLLQMYTSVYFVFTIWKKERRVIYEARKI